MADLRVTTIIEENYPPVRRNTIVGINNILKNTLAQTFLSLVEEPVENSQTNLKQSQEMILVHYKRIHNILDTVDEHIVRRLQNHENEVFSIVKNEIEQMKEETRIIILKLNEAIAKKNTEDEIFHLSNELDYFKNQTFKLFQENKKVRKENAELRRMIKENEIELQNSHRVMQKLKRNCMKEKIVKGKPHESIKQRINTLGKEEIISEDMIDHIFNEQKNKKESRKIKTQECDNKEEQKLVSKESSVNIGYNSSLKDKSILEIMEDNIQLSEERCYPNMGFDKTKNLYEMPGIKVKRIDSEIMSSSVIQSHTSLYKGIQANEIKESILNTDQKQSKVFSRNNFVQGAPLARISKNIDKVKKIFFMKTCNQSAKKTDKIEPLPTQSFHQKNLFKSRQIQYMSHALNKSKMKMEDIESKVVKSKSISKQHY